MSELSVFKRGKTWTWRFEGAIIDGKRQRPSKGGYKTKSEATKEGTKALNEYNNAGLYFTPSDMSYADFLDLWMEQYVKINCKPSTYINYEKAIRLHIKPALGKFKLKALAPIVIQDFINDRFNSGYSRPRLVNFKSILSGSLKYAIVPSNLIQQNPALMVTIPSTRAKALVPSRKKNRSFIPEEDIVKIFERFPEGTPAHIPLQEAYRCGLRLGEAFALTWDCVDFKKSTINIDKQIQYHSDGYMYFESPKYDSSRTIRIDPFMAQLLRRARIAQLKNKLKYGEYYTLYYVNENNMINTEHGTPVEFVNVRDNGTYIQPRTSAYVGRVIHYELGITGYDFHSLRHTHATRLAEAGANPKDIQFRLGHKSMKETLEIYEHVTIKMHEDSTQLIKQVFQGAIR